MPLTQQVADQIKKHAMLTTGETVVVAVSGGPDSVALLHILKQLQTGLDIRLVVAHLNHCLRGQEARDDALFVENLARRWQLECFVAARDVQTYGKQRGVSAQVAAREVRYDFLEEVAVTTSATKIALGHHADDQAETILLHLIRGSGTGGLVGMLPVRKGFFIRPLLTVRRSAIEDYCRHHGLKTRQDASNSSLKYLRNRVRLELAPLLEQNYNPNWVDGMNRMGEILRAEDEYLEQQVDLFYEQLQVKTNSRGVCCHIKELHAFPLALRRRLIRRIWRQLFSDESDLSFGHIDQILAIIKDGGGQRCIALPRGITGVKDGDILQLSGRALPAAPPFYQYHLAVPGVTAIPETKIILGAQILPVSPGRDEKPWLKTDPDAAWFDYDCLELPLVVRQRLPGDKFSPFGLHGSVKLKKFLIDCKVPRAQRDWLPIVESGKNIIWVAGVRPGDYCKITPTSKNYLKLYLMQQ